MIYTPRAGSLRMYNHVGIDTKLYNQLVPWATFNPFLIKMRERVWGIVHIGHKNIINVLMLLNKDSRLV